MFETITDPDFDGWFVTGAFDLLGQEIGDECEFYTANLTFFDVPSFKIGNKVYAVQREYSNKTHSCSTK